MLLKRYRVIDDAFHAYSKPLRHGRNGGKQAVQRQSSLIRFFDVTFAVSGLILLLPIMIISAAALKLTSRGPFLFVQERLGYGEKPFRMIKLRTMVDSAETKGPLWADTNDGRITPVGKFLRAAKIDELPQLFNILRGDMSLVGPRPVAVQSARLLQEHDPRYEMRFLVRPGLTGWAQLNVAFGPTVEEQLRKLPQDLRYLDGLSLSDYFKVVFKTFIKVYAKKG
jgi:lipopolysaccharide/colanic/teichoic acid biosynthesis glycosyltransferase